jgi:hypothetical protein
MNVAPCLHIVEWIEASAPPRPPHPRIHMGLLTLLRRLKRSDREVSFRSWPLPAARAVPISCVYVQKTRMIMHILLGANFGSRPRQLGQNYRSEKARR